MQKIPFIDLKNQYKLHKEAIDSSISNVLEHGQYIMGPEVSELESRLADYIGVKHVLACSSGTDALVLPLMARGIGKGDAVFTTPFTFFASAEAISLVGATPVFVDIDPDTYNIDPNKLQEAITAVIKKGELVPKLVMPVDLFGIAADFNSINKIAKKHDLDVLEDAAQSFGAKYFESKACGLADIGATSFYPAKPLGCYGDGGAIFTNNTELHDKLVSLRVHGQSTSGNKYDNERIGMNARMDTIQAAILIEKLKIYDQEIDLRNSVSSLYSQQLDSLVKTPIIPKGQGSVWAQYSIQVPNRSKLQDDLQKQGIPTAVFYPIPIHLSTAYKHLGYSVGDFPISERVADHIISLPMHPYLSEQQIEVITTEVNRSVTTS